jgi:hypothetical protein
MKWTITQNEESTMPNLRGGKNPYRAIPRNREFPDGAWLVLTRRNDIVGRYRKEAEARAAAALWNTYPTAPQRVSHATLTRRRRVRESLAQWNTQPQPDAPC